MSIAKENKRIMITLNASELERFEEEAKAEGFRFISPWLIICARERIRRNRGDIQWSAPLGKGE